MIELLPAFMILSLMVLVFVGYPVAFVLIGVTIAFATIAILTNQMSSHMLPAFAFRLYGLLADNLIFPAVPPLVFMGVALARSGLAGDLFDVLGYLLRRVPGGLFIAVIVLGVVLAPSAGLIGAAVGVLALVALPTLLKRNYRPELATASVVAGGTIGVILPPGIMLFFLADLIGTPLAGTFSGILLPAALMIAAYSVYFVARAHWQDKTLKPDPIVAGSRTPAEIIGKLVLPVGLVGGVLASILSGWATPSQSGALGALGAFVIMLVNRSLNWKRLREILIETGYVTSMVFLVVIAANAFSLVFRVLDGDGMVARLLVSLELGDWGTLLFILGVIFILGFFIDWLEIVLITLPIFVPVIEKLDFAAHVGNHTLVHVWIATAITIVLQTSFLTPPFGFALFFLRGAAPPSVRMADIYRGVVPLVGIQLVVLAIMLAIPWLATWLPGKFLD